MGISSNFIELEPMIKRAWRSHFIAHVSSNCCIAAARLSRLALRFVKNPRKAASF